MSAPDAVEREVQRIRNAVLMRHGLKPGDPVPAQRATSAIDDVQQLSTVSAHWGIASDMRVAGGFLVLFRRILRIMLRWYINPIVEQQNRFNRAAVRAIHELKTENDNLRAEVNRYIETREREHS